MLFNVKKTFTSLALISSVTLLSACGGSGGANELSGNGSNADNSPVQAVIQTVSPDFTGSSQVAYADGSTQEIEDGFYVQNATDYTISVFEENVYHIGRFFIDTITKYETNARDEEIYTYSTQEVGDSSSRNPQALVSVSDTKAYLIRLGADNVLIVNPAATSVEEYIIGELDISSYIVEGNNSGFNANTPNASAGVISDGKLFLAIQRFGIDFGSISTSYVAVFDIETDTEIETNANADDDLMGIPLTGFNPLNESLRAFEDKIYVTTNNSFLSSDITLSKIEEIDVNDFGLRTLFNASDVLNNTTGTITSSEILSAEQGYFYITSDPFGTPVSELYQFNPTTGDISTEPVYELNDASINFLDIDANGFLWLALTDNANPGVDIIDTETNTQFGNRLPTTLNATVVRFIEE